MGSLANSTHPQIIGGLPPPPGVVPNFIDPYSLRGIIIAITAVEMTVTTTVTALRMYTKLFILKSHGWEDCMYPP